MTREEFIKKIAPLVVKYAPQYNILCPSAVIAQAVLESDGGNSELAVKANNFFGLKYRAGRCPTGSGTYVKKGSEQKADGSYVSSVMTWQKFPNMEAGVKGYFDFTNIDNYKALKGVKDPKTYLEKIKAAGYATSLKYVDNVFAVVQKYNLTQYDIKKEYLIAIDCGHGSETGGKRTPDGYREHWINNHTAIYFDKAMQRCGIKTLKVAWDDYDATDDTDVALSTRQNQIKNAGCDISVSFHANASGNGKEYNSGQGIETFYHSTVSKAGDSKALATKVQFYLIKGTQQKNRGVKSSNFAMCDCTATGTKASVLVEIGFMTNEYEAELLMTDKFCYECAEEVAQGVCEYLDVKYVKGTFSEIDVKIGNYNKKVDVPLKINQSAKDIQKFLNTYYGTEIKKVIGALLSVDGDIGTKSKKALSIAFQVELNKLGADLDIDGSFGSKTEKAFDKYVGILKKGMKNNIFITLWQCVLVGNKLDPQGIDSSFGNGCFNATNSLFSKLGLTKDSTVSGNDLNKIL